MFAKHCEFEATARPMARMVALAIGGGWLVTPGVVDPAAAPRLVGDPTLFRVLLFISEKKMGGFC